MDSEKLKDKEELTRILNAALNDLDIKELWELGKQVSEKHLDKDDEMYKWYHSDALKQYFESGGMK